MPKFKWDILGDFQTLCKYIFFLHLGFLSTRRVSKHIGKHFYYVRKGSLDLIIASGVMNTFRMISLQALQATKVAHRPWANLCIIIWVANVAFQQKLSRSTSLHTISPFPLSNFRQFFSLLLHTDCVLKTTYCAVDNRIRLFFLASLVQQKKREHILHGSFFNSSQKLHLLFSPLLGGKLPLFYFFHWLSNRQAKLPFFMVYIFP